MRIFDTSIKETDNKNVVSVGLAEDNKIFYAALVDLTSKKCYVEEVGLTGAKSGFTGIYRKIDNEEEWQRIYNMFNKAGVFDKFLKGANYHWDKKNGHSNVPGWFKDKFIGHK